MKILAISDIHGWLPKIEVEADVLLIAGDLVPDGFNPTYDWAVTESNKKYWLRNDFSDWIASLPVKQTVVIAGNHDIPIQNDRSIMDDLPITYLECNDVTIDGVKIWGSPWSPTFGNWAFMASDESLVQDWEKIPEDVDILMTHTPPNSILDKTGPQWGSQHVGSVSLRNHLDYGNFPNLKLHVFGHIHSGRGRKIIERDSGQPIMFGNVTHVNEGYESVYPPMIFEI